MAGATAGIKAKPGRIFVTTGDVMKMFGCKSSCASAAIREVNKEAKSRGKFSFPAGKANKYIFSDMYEIPIEEIDAVISEEM